MALTMAAVADNKNIKLKNAEIQIGHHISGNKPSITEFQIAVKLENGLTRRERTILFNSARACEMHKMLAGQFKFDYQLLPDESAHAFGRSQAKRMNPHSEANS